MKISLEIERELQPTGARDKLCNFWLGIEQ